MDETKTDMELKYPISQIKRNRILEGKLVYSVINNGGSYFVIDLPVYEDGVFDCWENVDINGLKNKINIGWLTPSIPNGEHFSIHHLGSYRIRDCKWGYTKESYPDFLISVVKSMNPAMENIFNSGGQTSKVIGNKNYSVFNCSSKELVRQDSKTPSFKDYKGKREHYFYKDSTGEYYLASMNVYSDSTILIEGIPSNKSITIEEVKKLIDDSVLTCELPVGAKVNIKDLGSFLVEENRYNINIHDKLSELSDVIARLNGNQTTSDICYDLFKEYKQNPGKELKQKLKEAYENIPAHLRVYVLGDMDAKGWPIRSVIYEKE